MPGKKRRSALGTACLTGVIGYEQLKLFAALVAPGTFLDRVADGRIIVHVIAIDSHQRHQGDATLANVERKNKRQGPWKLAFPRVGKVKWYGTDGCRTGGAVIVALALPK